MKQTARSFFKAFIVSMIFTAVSLAAVTGREIRNFDAGWLFQKGDGADSWRTELDDSSWKKLNVPHDWSIEGPFDAKAVTLGSGGFLPSGVAWYRKHFNPGNDMKRRTFIEFDGVMANAEVWVNNFYLGKRPYGYSSFGYDLSDHLNFGKDNVIVVKTDTSQQPASRWYTGAGIYRHVRLVITDPIHIEKWSNFVTTPEVSPDEATINLKTTVKNESTSKASGLKYEFKVLNSLGRQVAYSLTQPGEIDSRSGMNVEFNVLVAKPELWNPGAPTMYKAVISIISGGKMIDSETVPFGIRSFEFVPATGFWLNGKNFKLKGACLHHDGSAFGAAVPLAVWERRLNELRKLGVNAIRTAHNPPSPDFLDLTDRMGFLVMDETFDQWTLGKNTYDYHLAFNEWAKIDTRDMVLRDRNHPSVVIYSAGNEIRDNHADQEKAKQTLKGMVDVFHEHDPTRPVTQALFRPNIEGANDYNNGLAEILDVVGQNYREKEILAAYKQKPTRKIIGTENAHDLNQWIAMRDNPEYSGQFIWAGIDYLGESAAWPNYAYGKGLLDRTAMPRPVGFQRQSWWSDRPMVYIARRVAPAVASPTDPGYEVAEQKRTQTLFGDWTPKDLGPHQENAEIYSNCDEVELFLNGTSLGSKPKPKDDSPRNWKVNFEVGTIKAVGKNGGKIVAEFEMKTAGKPAKIVLTTDKPWIANDWNDVAFISASIVDANGVLIPAANDMIRFSVTGSGVIAAVDSADNADHDPFQSKQRRAFQGTCFALVKGSKLGQVVLTASGPGLVGAKINIGVK
ncbi:MAG: glycoside hydrolase family 2 TIM barrel-domain containing protein [Pyrinomonadaceae bacterium]